MLGKGRETKGIGGDGGRSGDVWEVGVWNVVVEIRCSKSNSRDKSK
jgi:hypothetical protein